MTQKVRALSSGESEFYAQGSWAARGLLMKHICHEAGEPTKTRVLHCDSVASRGMAQRLGAGKCRHIEVKWLWLHQTWTRRSSQRNTFRLSQTLLPSERDERQDMETDEPDGNEFGCWVECLVQQTMETNTGTSIES